MDDGANTGGDAVAETPRSKRSASRRPSIKSEATRQRMLDAAAEVFADVGYGEALLHQIADKAEIHVTALYYYFDNKESIAEAMMNYLSQ